MLINSVASLMSLTLSTGQMRLIRAPSGLPRAPVTPAACPHLRFPRHWQARHHPPHPSPTPWLLGPLHAAQLRAYYMTSRVNQGSINAKSTAGLTYQTQLRMLNTRPQQQTGQEQRNINEALCGVCSAPPVCGRVYRARWWPSLSLCVCTGGAQVPCFRD